MESLSFFIGLAILVISSIIIFALIFKENILKAFFVLTVCMAISFILYNQYEAIKGLPSGNKIENNFVLRDFIIDKPNDLIYLWVIIDGASYPENIKIPYTDEREKNLRKLENELESKSIIKIEGKIKKETEDGEPIMRFRGLRLEDAPEMRKKPREE